MRRAWEQIKIWLDWHGRVAAILTIIVALGGAALANRIASIWGNVSGGYLWIVSSLVFVVFMCSLILASRARDARRKDLVIPPEDSPGTPKASQPKTFL